jgi:tRNA dimethylallyltransferase
MSSLGYPQIGSYIRQECSLDEAKVLLNQVTWQYAKRQMTWFRRDKKIEWFESEAEKNLEEKIKTFLA